MTRAVRAIAAVLVGGAAIGTAIALADRDVPLPVRAASTPVAAAAAPTTSTHPIAVVGGTQIVARVADPGGGPDWALRRFVVHDRHRNGKTYIFPCVQLGRLDGTRFGWIAPGQSFRLARWTYESVPYQCGAKFLAGRPNLDVATLTTDAARGVPAPATTIVWGALAPDTASVRLRAGTTLRAGAHGAALAVLAPRPVGEPAIAGTLRTRAGATRSFDLARRLVTSGRASAPTATAVHVVARTPDPAGGAAWGIVAGRGPAGETCLSEPGRIVGDRLSYVDPLLGLARPSPFNAAPACPARLTPTAAQPIRANVSGFSIHDEDPAGTVQLRRLQGRVALAARTTADVETVTITTSRDVRTLIPDPETHVVLAVYDGTFPGEDVKLTAHLRSGATATVVQTLGG